MKNREKFRDEILQAIIGGNSCGFMKDKVAQEYLDSRESSDVLCEKIGCTDCIKLFAFWLDGDYEAPTTDWANVPVDTLVRVRDDENGEWFLRYFNRFDESSFSSMAGHNYSVFADGATSITGRDYVEHWKYCELAEEEE
ncbi:MAG: hypothetical protein JTJ23_13010 [Fusicatenibacter saccharivorans]|uniref:Uncharacterized protein n=1 Tax=Fusicatenibacter saccharivorans TaxID=1150298 RepID=A0A938Z7S8_9FIRM|nr:hypothetical protein [Fusicatenibacter saccharivorans]